MRLTRLLLTLCLLCSASFAEDDIKKVVIHREPVVMVNEPHMIRVVISSDLLYRPGTSIFRKGYPTILRRASALVQRSIKAHQGHITLVEVAPSVDDIGRDRMYRDQLMMAQANHVAAYLWSTGLPSHYIKVLDHLPNISGNRSMAGRADNRRVEIRIHVRGEQ